MVPGPPRPPGSPRLAPVTMPRVLLLLFLLCLTTMRFISRCGLNFPPSLDDSPEDMTAAGAGHRRTLESLPAGAGAATQVSGLPGYS